MPAPTMTLRRVVLPVVLISVGIFALVVLQWKLDLGEFAESPQLVELPWGARSIVGGGRAAVDFDQLDGNTATLRLWCSEHEVQLRLQPDHQTDEVCGVRIRLLGFLSGRDASEQTRVALEVTWNDSEAL